MSSIDNLDDDDFRRHNPRYQDEALANNLALVAKVHEIAQAKGITPGQLALAWYSPREQTSCQSRAPNV